MKKKQKSSKFSIYIIAAWASLVSILLFFPNIYLQILKELTTLDKPQLYIYLFVIIFGLITDILMYLAFYYYAIKEKLRFLKFSSLSFMLLSVISVCYEIGSIYFLNSKSDQILNIVYTIVIGVSTLIFGISILPLKKTLGHSAKWLGILCIIAGGLFITVILAILALPIILAMIVLQSIVMFKIAKKME